MQFKSQKSIGKYALCMNEPLGSGQSNKVVLGWDGIQFVAVKIIDKSSYSHQTHEVKKHQIEAIKRECIVHSKLQHPNIVRLYDYYETSSSIYMFLEKCECTLKQFIENQVTKHNGVFPEIHLKLLMRQLFQGCQYLLDQGYCHMDIKPQNILLLGNTIKLADFGLCTNRQEQLQHVGQGTPHYMSPEQLNGQHIDDLQKHDVWGAGVILYEIVYHKHPYLNNPAASPVAILKIYKETNIQFKQQPYSEQVINLLQGMLDTNHTTRFTWEQCYQHPWLQS